MAGGVPLPVGTGAPENSTQAASASRAVTPLAVVVWAPPEVRALLAEHLGLPSDIAGDDAQSVLTRRAQRDAAALLATEGYFSVRVSVRRERDSFIVEVDTGPRTRVERVDIDFSGALAAPDAAARRDELTAAWPLQIGEPFRSTAWESAKEALLTAVSGADYAAARIADSRAEIDPERATARLRVAVDSGPAYHFGALSVEGLRRYDESLVSSQAPFVAGDRYRRDALLSLQSRLQNTPWFHSVNVEADPATAADDTLPVRVSLAESPSHRLGFGVGYSTNNGARSEISYRDYDFLSRAWELGGGLRLEQKSQSLFSDLALLPGAGGYRPVFTARVERSDIQGLITLRHVLGASRSRITDDGERWHGIDWQREERRPDGVPTRADYALVLDWRRIHRAVDNLIDPRRGYVVDLRVGGASRNLFSDTDFVRTQLRLQTWWPLGKRDTLTLRGEVGLTGADSRVGIPQDYLFRTGGTSSVRGHSYQSLGVIEGQAIVGGRALAVASVEYTHWLSGNGDSEGSGSGVGGSGGSGGSNWGFAIFVDAGDATDRWADLDPATGAGFGLRWRSPAGPLAFDLARGSTSNRWHPHFALMVAF